MLALPLQDVPSDSPAASRLAPPGTTRRRAEPPAGPPAPTDGSCLPIPTDPPASTLLRRPDRWRSRLPCRSRSSARASNPGPPGGHLEDLAVACRTCPQSGWAPASGRVRPPDTRLRIVSADQSLLRTPGSGWPGDGHGGLLERPVGRTSLVQCDRLADGSGPGPDGGGQAADTSSAQRPTMRLASRPRPTTRPARPGPDRTGRQCACSLRPTQPRPASGPVRRDTCTHARCRNVRKPGPRPMSARSCPASRMDATIGQPSGRRLSGRSGRTPSTPPGTPWRTGSDADRERTNVTEGVRTSSIATTTRRPTRTRRALACGAGVCGWATKVGSAMARLPTRP
jgi:hypothetical protein